MMDYRVLAIGFPTLILLLLFFFDVPSNIALKYILQSSSPNTDNNNNNNNITTLNHEQPPTHQYNLSILIGVLTRPDNYERRHLLRLVYGTQTSPIAEIHVKFIFCNLTKPDQRVVVALEIMRFNDIIILNCTENMNSGKTYTYFSSLPQMLSRHYDYVMKADDDTYVRLDTFALSLSPLPRKDLYYGFVSPCSNMNPFTGYMSGMGYVLSWDIVEWISSSEIPKNDTNGHEDLLVGRWLKVGNKAKNRFTIKPGMYDYPGVGGRCSHEFIPDTVAIHRVKKWDQWVHALEYFNVTQQVNPSKLYYI